jgi:hypothetical protein
VRCTIPFFSKRDNLQWTERLLCSRPSMKESAQIWSYVMARAFRIVTRSGKSRSSDSAM